MKKVLVLNWLHEEQRDADYEVFASWKDALNDYDAVSQSFFKGGKFAFVDVIVAHVLYPNKEFWSRAAGDILLKAFDLLTRRYVMGKRQIRWRTK